MVWLRSIKRVDEAGTVAAGSGPAASPLTPLFPFRLPKRRLEIHSGHSADPRDRFPHLVVRGRGAGGDADDRGPAQPVLGNDLGLGPDRLVTNSAGADIYRIGIFDVIRGDPVLLHQGGKVAGVTGVVSPDDDHDVERLLQ